MTFETAWQRFFHPPVMGTGITVSDFFAGAGGNTTGAEAAGATSVFALNHWQQAIESHAANHPHVDHAIEDIREREARYVPETDIFIASPECFPAGTLILTSEGLVPIEDVKIGMKVLTHKNRWMPVTNTMVSKRNTIIVKGAGHNGLETTPEHPFYVMEQRQRWNNDIRQYRAKYLWTGWVRANRLATTSSNEVAWSSPHWKAHRWATPTEFGERLQIPEVGGRGAIFNENFWWMVGRWLGDGSVRIRKRRGSYIEMACGFHEVDDLEPRLNYAYPVGKRAGKGEYRWTRSDAQGATAAKFACAHNGLVEWLVNEFGHSAHGKTIPAWVMTMPESWRTALLDGYVSADGHKTDRKTMCASVSKQLALGIRLIAASLGFQSTFREVYRQSTEIDGRTISAYTTWEVSWESNGSHRETHCEDGKMWSLVKSVEDGGKNITVYNISVEGDESYVADGIVVHNCTFHSKASGRKRIARNQMCLWEEFEDELDKTHGNRSRLLMQQVIKFTEHHRYKAVIVENVTDVHYWQHYSTWWREMENLGYLGYELNLNARFFGVPQSRDRWYAVFVRSDMPQPDLDFCPPAYNPKTETWVNAVQVWKRHERQWGSYGPNGQYIYVDPTTGDEVFPAQVPAATVIDWSIAAEKIGERKRPLSENTINRIKTGLKKYYGTHAMDMAYNGKSKALTEPLWAQTTRQTQGLVVSYYTRNSAHSHTSEPLPTIPTENKHALVVPEAFMATYNNNSIYAKPDEPIPTVTTVDRISLIVTQYNNAGYRKLHQPLPTQTTVNKNTLVDGPLTGDLDEIVNNCTFRMLQPSELKLGMSFPDDYIILGTKRDQVRQIGGAVAPNVMQAIVTRVIEVIA